MKRNFTCINCPMGCSVDVTLNDKGEITDIEGNSCPLGEKYVRNEIKDPRRMVTSTVRLLDSKDYSVSVKTQDAIPKNKIFDAMEEINQVEAHAPIKVGDVVIEDIADTGIDLIATAEKLD